MTKLPDSMAEDEIKKMLDDTILDWNRPSQLEAINADTNYRKLIPAINVYTTNKIIDELEGWIQVYKRVLITMPEFDTITKKAIKLNIKQHEDRIAELRKTL